MLRNNKIKILRFLLVVFTMICFVAGFLFGAVEISIEEMVNATKSLFINSENLGLNERIFMSIRMPRALLCLICGAALGAGGVLLQALFRNPLLDPGLIGTSGGAAFGASVCMLFAPVIGFQLSGWALPVSAFAGASVATLLVVGLSFSKTSGKTNTITLLLIGIAISALFSSGVGFMTYIARDPQARSITFWNLGSLSGASWTAVLIGGTATLTCLFFTYRLTKPLNALMLGEQEALYLGVNVRKLKWTVLFLNTLMVAAITSFVGIIGFVGLVVPHIVRLIFGADNKQLLPASALCGACLVSLSDLAARLLVQPAELPIGIITSVIGVPVFITLIRSNKYFF